MEEQRGKRGHDGAEIVIPVQYIDWQTAESGTSHTICVLTTSSKESYQGIAGWYSESHGGTTTVMLRFGTRRGLPRAVIDDYLKRYPSSIRGVVPLLESWEVDDVAKWMALLETRADDEAILSVASKHLGRYDSAAFGLNEAWIKRSDPPALADAIRSSVGRMQAWLNDRVKAERKGPRP